MKSYFLDRWCFPEELTSERIQEFKAEGAEGLSGRCKMGACFAREDGEAT